MITQLKIIPSGKAKGKSSSKTQDAADKLDYLITFNRSMTQGMAKTMQDLTEGVFINLAKVTLPHRDSYIDSKGCY